MMKMNFAVMEKGEMMNDLISRQAAIDALWKALYEYEDKTEKQFIESDELNIEDWVQHRIFVQNMNDIDRQTILEIPSAQQWIPCSTEVIPCKECKWHGYLTCSNPDGIKGWVTDNDFCSYVERREDG